MGWNCPIKLIGREIPIDLLIHFWKHRRRKERKNRKEKEERNQMSNYRCCKLVNLASWVGMGP